MAQRTYDQYCAGARALEVLGERWTLLVVRDLLLGPKRYTDLQAGLPGIGPNVLAGRLRQLQDAGVIRRRTLPPPAASTVYELTPLGEELRPLVRELVRWGRRLIGPPRDGEQLRLGWLLVAMEASFRPELARGLRESYEFRIDGEVFHVDVDDGAVRIAEGEAEDPAFVVVSDLETFMAVAGLTTSMEQAEAAGRMTFSGDREACARSIAILGPHFLQADPGGGIVGALRATLEPAARAGIAASIELHVDGHVLSARLGPGGVDVRSEAGHVLSARLGPGGVDVRSEAAERPDVVVDTDLPTLLATGTGQERVEDAVAAGRARITGDRAVWQAVVDAVERGRGEVALSASRPLR